MARTGGKTDEGVDTSRSACPTLRTALLTLEPTREGFEGLISALVEAATGGRLLLMSSGDQGGLDAVGAPVAKSPRRAMQAKRYGGTSALNLNTLLGEMDRADSAFPGIDCWILATTKTLLGKEQAALRSHAHSLGWGFVALEWNTSGRALPRLAVLCAAFPEITLTWPGLAGCEADLDQLAAHPGFATARRQLLEDLQAADAGFLPMRSLATAQLDRIFTDPWAARALAGPSPALLADAPPVHRAGLIRQLVDWWTGGAQVLALLGEEGMGKTWAGLAGLRAIDADEAGPLPLIISCKAAVAADDGLNAVVKALCDLFAQGAAGAADPAAFWRRRLEQWSHPASGAQPRILVMIDGLDEADPFDWARWLAPLLASPWRPVFRLILACRRDDWEQRVRLPGLGERLVMVGVGRFEAAERDAYLVSRGVDPAKVGGPALEVARHPRTAFHLTRLKDELGGVSQITREQLLLRDFQNRLDVKGGLVGADAFHELVTEMAGRAQSAALNQQAFSITSGEVVDHVASLTGYERREMRGILGELVSGRWCRRDPNNANHLTFVDAALPDAVGLALAGRLRSLEPQSALAEIERFLEPWNADDLVEPVLRTCATALVTDDRVSDALCDAVLKLWLDKPFRGLAGQDFWRRLHVFRPTIFVDLAAQAGRRNPWIQEWGLACFWEDHPQFAPLIMGRLYDWMTVMAQPSQHLTRNPPLAISGREPRRQARGLALLVSHEPTYWPDRLPSHLDPRPRPLQHVAARVIGFLPRAPFVPILTGWALSCAAAGRPVSENDVAILLRDNEHDHELAMAAVGRAVAGLETSGTGLGRRAATLLRRATGRPEDAVGLAERRWPADLSAPRIGRPWVEIAGVPPGCHVRLEDKAPPATLLLSVLVEAAADPDVGLGPDVDRALTAWLEHQDAERAFWWFANNLAQRPVLARWRAQQMYALLGKAIVSGPVVQHDGTVSPPDETEYLDLVDELLPILSSDQRAAAIAHLALLPGEKARTSVAALQLTGLPLQSQIERLLGLPQEDWPDRFEHLLSRPTGDEPNMLVASLDFQSPGPALTACLVLAVAVANRFHPAGHVVRDWRDGFEHADSGIRNLIVEVAKHFGGLPAAQQLVASMNRSPWPQTGRLDFFASDLLFALDDEALRPLLSRLSPEVLGKFYQTRPNLAAGVAQAWRGWMAERLLTPRTEWTMGAERREFVDREEAYAAFVVDHRHDATDLVKTAWETRTLRGNLQHDDGEGPTWPLMLALAEHEPELVERIWRESVDLGNPFRRLSAEDLPARLPAGDRFDDLRRHWLAQAHDDGRLFRMVRLLERHGHETFLHAEIAKGLNSARPLDAAWAVTVAGFLADEPKATALWDAGALAAPPGAGWLAEVWAKSRVWFMRARATRVWWRRTAQADSEVDALGAFWLFRQVADPRYVAYALCEGTRIDPRSWRAQWLTFMAKKTGNLVDAAIKPLSGQWLHGPRYGDVLNGR